MIQPRKVICAVCGKERQERNYGEGWPGWGQLNGIILNGDENPYLCEDHLAMTANFVDSLVDNEGSE